MRCSNLLILVDSSETTQNSQLLMHVLKMMYSLCKGNRGWTVVQKELLTKGVCLLRSFLGSVVNQTSVKLFGWDRMDLLFISQLSWLEKVILLTFTDEEKQGIQGWKLICRCIDALKYLCAFGSSLGGGGDWHWGINS